MASYEQAKQAMANTSSPTVAASTLIMPRPASDAASNDNHTLGQNPQDFIRDNRIQVKDGSLFVDSYLVIHPHELDPANEDKLRRKMQLTYSINNPSFFEAPDREAIALNLGLMIPTTVKSDNARVVNFVQEYNRKVDTGVDAGLQQSIQDFRHPFAAIVREAMQKPTPDPVVTEVHKNSIAMYLLIREKLTQMGYRNELASYVPRHDSSNQVMAALSERVGVSAKQMREAAFTGGLDGVGKLLGLDPKYVANVKQLADYAQANDFGYNLVEHWHLGRQLLGLDAPLAQKITTGMDARITSKIAEYRAKIHQQYEVPKPVAALQEMVAAKLNLLEPIQRKLMYAMGYEICYTPESRADKIAFYPNIWGLHRKAANDLRDFRSTNRVFIASHDGDLQKADGTFAHECAHQLWPDHFSSNEVPVIDQLAASDAQRFANLNRMLNEHFPQFEQLLNAYHAASAPQKAAVIAQANQLCAPYGITVDGLFPHLREAHTFQYMVSHAFDALHVDGALYSRNGYEGPQERFREVISRFADLRQVGHRDDPELVKFLAPGLTKIWDEHYIPHLERVYGELMRHGPDAVYAQVAPIPHVVRAAPTQVPHLETAIDAKIEQRPEAPTAPSNPAPTIGEGEQPRKLEQPKVEERPAEPVAPAPVQPAAPLSVTVKPPAEMAPMLPANTVDKNTIVNMPSISSGRAPGMFV